MGSARHAILLKIIKCVFVSTQITDAQASVAAENVSKNIHATLELEVYLSSLTTYCTGGGDRVQS